jgi:predicted nuclease with TOPRIM domain
LNLLSSSLPTYAIRVSRRSRDGADVEALATSAPFRERQLNEER